MILNLNSIGFKTIVILIVAISLIFHSVALFIDGAIDNTDGGIENLVLSQSQPSKDSISGEVIFYLDSIEGDDANSGKDPNDAWRTIERLNTGWENGDISTGDDILFKRGGNFTYSGRIYPSIGGTGINPMIIGAYGSGVKPILCNSLSGSNGKTIQGTDMKDTGHYIFEDLNITGCSDDGFSLSEEGTHNITLRRIDLFDVGGYGVLFRHINTFKIEDCVAIDIGVSAFLAHGSYTDHTRNGKFWNLTIKNTGVDGIVFHTKNEDDAYVGSNHWIENASISGCGEAGIDVSFGNNPRANLYVHNVEIWDCNQGGIAAGHRSKYETYDNIYIHDMINFNFGNTDDEHLILRNSILEDWGTLGSVINQGKEGYNAKNITYYNNAFISKGTMDFIKLIDPQGGETRDLSFKNNIFLSKSSSSPDRFIYYSTPGMDLENTNSTWSNNIYWRGDGGDTNGNWWYMSADRYMSFDSWKSNPGVSGEILQNPLFKSISSGDFRLQELSPCIDSGDWLTRTVSIGEGNKLVVKNANFFMDGYEIDGLFGDEIIVGANPPVRIESIDYTRNEIRINRSIKWSSGDPVNLIYTNVDPWQSDKQENHPIYGTPDIGPIEFKPGFDISIDPIDITSDVRIYSDGSYRYLDSPANGIKSNITIRPEDESIERNDHLLDIEFIGWSNEGEFFREWIEYPGINNGNIIYSIDGLPINTHIVVKLDNISRKVIQTNITGCMNFTLPYSVNNRNIELVPVSEPVIIDDRSESVCYNGLNLSLEIVIFDNVAVTSANVEYWYDGDASHSILPLVLKESEQFNSIFIGAILIDNNRSGSLSYKIFAFDSDENDGESIIRSIPILDVLPPVIVDDFTLSKGYTGDLFQFNLISYDNIGIEEVVIRYWFTDDVHHEVSLIMQDSFIGIITIPSDYIGYAYYSIHVTDLSGNILSSEVKEIIIVDNDPPMLIEDRTKGDNGKVSLSVWIRDNIDVKNTYVEYWFKPEMRKNISMVKSSGYILSFDTNLTETTLFYLYHFEDPSGNWNHSEVFQLWVTDSPSSENDDEKSIVNILIIVIAILTTLLLVALYLLIFKFERKDKMTESLSHNDESNGNDTEKLKNKEDINPVKEKEDDIESIIMDIDNMGDDFSGVPQMETDEEILNNN